MKWIECICSGKLLYWGVKSSLASVSVDNIDVGRRRVSSARATEGIYSSIYDTCQLAHSISRRMHANVCVNPLPPGACVCVLRSLPYWPGCRFVSPRRFSVRFYCNQTLDTIDANQNKSFFFGWCTQTHAQTGCTNIAGPRHTHRAYGNYFRSGKRCCLDRMQKFFFSSFLNDKSFW